MGQRGEAWVVVQGILLLALILAPAGGRPWQYATVFLTVGWLLILFAVVLLLWSAKSLGRSLTPFPRPLPGGVLVVTGAYSVVRHPIYLAVVMGALGLSLITYSPTRLAVTVLLLLFFDLKARREERWLREQYPGYAAYTQRVKRLLPWIY